MERSKWVDRKFSFDYPIGWFPNIMERLEGASVRINELTASLTEMQAGQRHDANWSIKEHLGHLADLEDLHEGRVDDFVARRKLLRAADMSNAKTNEADHNARSLRQLVNDFTVKRRRLIYKFQKLDEETHNFKSLHPRLRKKMRPVDVAYFTAEHDDHHLASIRQIRDITAR